MIESVRKHYEMRPASLKNTADSKPIDIDIVEEHRRLEQAVGTTCTQQVVSVTIESNE
jgi:hypothetical protein